MGDVLTTLLAVPGAGFAIAGGVYGGIGAATAELEVRACRAAEAASGTGDRAPVWPVWLVVWLLWPMLVAQKLVLAGLDLWDFFWLARDARRDARREAGRGPWS